MVKLFLVEDEIVMRDGIKKHIDWEREGIEFVGEASDGELAYPQILNLKPDILITDIKMPFMDGLELSELVKKELPELCIIILSGYDEFSYAQKAVSLGVTEYLLKPISPAKLLESIRKVAQRIEAERTESERQSDWAKEEEKEKQLLMKLKLFNGVIMNSMSASEVLELAKKLSINLTAGYYRMLLLQFSVSGEPGDSFSAKRNAFHQQLLEIAERHPGWHVFDRGIDGFAILMVSDSREALEEIQKAVEEIVRVVGEHKDASYFIGIGSVVRRLSEIRESYNEASRAFSYRFLAKKDQVIYADRERSGHGENGDLDVEMAAGSESPQKAIESFLKTGSFDEVGSFLEGVFHSVGEQNVQSLIFLNYLTMDIYFSMVRFLKELGSGPEEIDRECGNINDFVGRGPSWIEVRDYLTDYMQRVIRLRDSGSAKKNSRVVHAALEYIDSHYDKEDITLNSVASKVNISPNHFSSIFSQEMGITFIEYLIGKRMEKAKELLMTTDLKSFEVAYRVGYKDPHYFSYTFKKTQGMTTKEFRARGQDRT